MPNYKVRKGQLIAKLESNIIAAGNIKPKYSDVQLDTEAAASTDDLDTVTMESGMIIIIHSASSSRDPTIKDATILTAGDFTLTSSHDSITLKEIGGGTIMEMCRSDNAT